MREASIPGARRAFLPGSQRQVTAMKQITYALKPKSKRGKAAAALAPRPAVIVTAKPPKQIDAYKRLKLREETGR
jgi:hypothetical protein